MIGLYVQNTNTLTQLLDLLKGLPVEAYHSNRAYESVLWLADRPAPKGVSAHTLSSETLPFSASEWRLFIQRTLTKPVCYRNNTFLFDASKRLLTDLTTQKVLPLTEKETAFLSFLALQPECKATKEAVLQNVWQYNPDTETHTLESHLYALKQKIGPHADELITAHNGYFCLI